MKSNAVERLEVRLTPDENRMLRARCLAMDVPVQVVARRLLGEWAEGNIETVWDDPVDLVLESIGGSA